MRTRTVFTSSSREPVGEFLGCSLSVVGDDNGAGRRREPGSERQRGVDQSNDEPLHFALSGTGVQVAVAARRSPAYECRSRTVPAARRIGNASVM